MKMNIILKTSLKNIFGKFGRTLLVTFSIFVCSICALLCFDLVSTIKEAITVMFGSITSGDIIALVEDYSVKGLPDGYPEVELMEINSNHDTLYEEIEGEYAFVTSKSLNIYGIDVEEAVNMGFMDQAESGTWRRSSPIRSPMKWATGKVILSLYMTEPMKQLSSL